MVNINLVCQSVPKEPLQARVSKGAVATAITACGFVTILLCSHKFIYQFVATAITACGFVTSYVLMAFLIGFCCNSDYRLRYKKET